MQSLDFYTVSEFYEKDYYELPKLFFSNKTYKNMSSDAKIAYAVLKDKLNVAINNNWRDENDLIYFNFTDKEWQYLLNCDMTKVSKVKTELIKTNLLCQKRAGINNLNRLYLLKPMPNPDDVYTANLQQQTLESKGFSKDELNPCKENIEGLQDTEKDWNQLNDYAETLEELIDNQVAYSIPEKARKTLLYFSFNDYAELDKQIGMIFGAKKEVSKKTDTSLVIESFEDAFINQVRIIALAMFKDKKSFHKVKNYDAYFYKSFVRYFEDQADKEKQIKERLEKTQSLPTIPMDY